MTKKVIKQLQNSIFVYALNSVAVMLCLAAVIFIATNKEVDPSVIAVVAGSAGATSASIIGLMIKQVGGDTKEDTSKLGKPSEDSSLD